MRKIAKSKEKVKEVTRVVEKGKQEERRKMAAESDPKNKNVKQSKKTRGVLLQKTITRALYNHINSSSVVFNGHAKFIFNSKGTSKYIISGSCFCLDPYLWSLTSRLSSSLTFQALLL